MIFIAQPLDFTGATAPKHQEHSRKLPSILPNALPTICPNQPPELALPLVQPRGQIWLLGPLFRPSGGERGLGREGGCEEAKKETNHPLRLCPKKASITPQKLTPAPPAAPDH